MAANSLNELIFLGSMANPKQQGLKQFGEVDFEEDLRWFYGKSKTTRIETYLNIDTSDFYAERFYGKSKTTRIETNLIFRHCSDVSIGSMANPKQQELKHFGLVGVGGGVVRFYGKSKTTRIETKMQLLKLLSVLMVLWQIQNNKD